MKKKVFLTLIMGCMLCISIMAVGVYAISFLKLNLVGKIDFVSFDKLVYLEKVEIKNFVETTDNGLSYKAKTKVLEDYCGIYLGTSNGVAPIDLSNLSVIKGEDLIVEFTFVSLYAGEDLYATASSTSPNGITVSATPTRLPANVGEKISTGTSAVFSILITNTSTGTINLSNLSINISFQDGPTALLYLLKTATDENGNVYHYIEMGTYNNEPVQWRYIADENGEAYTSEIKPTTIKGYYLLETGVSTNIPFLTSTKYAQNTSDSKYYHTTEGYTNIYAHDYGLSDIRAYLTNTGVGGFMESLGITNENNVYNVIKSKSIIDLYSGIKKDGVAIDSTNANYSLSLTGKYDISGQSDKFWLLSYDEATIFFSDNASRVWSGSSALRYWLRSPYSSETLNAYRVSTSGSRGNNNVGDNGAIRAAFIIA